MILLGPYSASYTESEQIVNVSRFATLSRDGLFHYVCSMFHGVGREVHVLLAFVVWHLTHICLLLYLVHPFFSQALNKISCRKLPLHFFVITVSVETVIIVIVFQVSHSVSQSVRPVK